MSGEAFGTPLGVRWGPLGSLGVTPKPLLGRLGALGDVWGGLLGPPGNLLGLLGIPGDLVRVLRELLGYP